MKPESQTQYSQTQFEKNSEDNKMKWLGVRAEVIKITQERLKQLSPTRNCQLSKDQQSYIESLTDPQVTVVVCQGGAGTGKPYTAMLTACIAVQAGLLANVKQTKPLASTGGVGLGHERGDMSDKLKYWCAPAREAVERMNLSEEDGKKVEAFPIDRTRGISVPAMDWMIFDEMQNTPKALFGATMTRAEQDDKVVICGDIKQQDVIATKGLGMHTFLKTWDGIDMRAKELDETLQQLEMKQKEDTNVVKDIEKVRTE